MSNQDAVAALATLTPRQRQVAVMKARGMTADAIASSLCLSSDVVRFHLNNARRRLGIKNSVQLAVICTLAGEVTTWKEAA